MKNKLLLSLLLLASVACVLYLLPKDAGRHILLFSDGPESDEGGEAGARAKWELMRLADPATGRIPANIRARELAFAATLPRYDHADGRASIPTFNHRGPWNVGGRSRTLAVDVTNDSIIFSGSVNGGLWRSADGGATWTCVSRRSQIPAITCIAQDTRPGHTNVWYYGTGEGYGTSAGAASAFYSGNGLYKSIDGGLTWDSIPATYSSAPGVVESYDINWAIATDPSDPDHDVIYAATLFYGIRISKDGGATWSIDLNSDNAYFTDIKVSPTGIAYAAVSHGTGAVNSGMWRKQNSVWTKISPPDWDTTVYNRYVIAINPSDENEVYFLGGDSPYHGKKTLTWTDDIEYNSLWRYNYLSGDGSGSGGQWTDLSQNLPGDTTKSFGNFYSQGGYDLVVAVHPDSSNIVFVGGTNLYRSTDGFTSPNNTKLIGGYDPSYDLPFYQVYPNHHPDQHGIAFLPSNPNVMLQTNDGGIYKTTDCLADSIHWLSLNDGYMTSQFYTIAIDHGPVPNDIILGGLQDNGTWFTNSSSLTKPWTMPGAGDGSFCYIADGHQTYYMSRQQGSTAKATLDADGNVTAFQRMDPITGLKKEEYIFINPFLIDPTNNNAMFMAAGKHVWRNDALDQIPLNNEWDSISQGWFKFQDSVPTNSIVTALAMSRVPAGRLYVGTSRRNIYRIDNPYAAHPTWKNITATKPPNSFNGAAYISCIAVDPTDANKVMVVFSNYGIYSMYYTTTGDTPWVKVGGNLEKNGEMSMRWASIVPVSNGTVYLVGTSVGLFGTSLLMDTSTLWTQLDPNGIGNMVVDMIDYRSSDQLVVVATHGSGVYSAIIDDILPVGVKETEHEPVSKINVFPNPANSQAMVSYSLLKADDVSLKVYDAKGNVVQTGQAGRQSEGNHDYVLERKNLAAGIYFINIKAGASYSQTRKIIFRD